MAITSINKQNHKFQNLQLLNLTHCRNFYFLKFFFSFFQIFGSYESAFGISWICFEKHPLNKKKGYFEKLACWNIYCYHKKTSQILSPISLLNTKKKEIFAFFFFWMLVCFIDHRSWPKLQNWTKKNFYLSTARNNTILKKKVAQLQNFKLHQIFTKKTPNSSEKFHRP